MRRVLLTALYSVGFLNVVSAAGNSTNDTYSTPGLLTSTGTTTASKSTSTGLASYILSAIGVTASSSDQATSEPSSATTSSLTEASASAAGASSNASTVLQYSSSSVATLANATITSPATLTNGSLPAPYTTWHNYTYATSCGYSDSGCLATCYDYASSCSSEWTDYIGKATVVGSSIMTSVATDTLVSTIAQISVNSTYTFTLTNTYPEAGETGTVTGVSTVALASGTASLSTSYSLFTYSSPLYSYSTTAAVPAPGCPMPNFGHVDPCTSACNPNYCTVSGGTVDLLYWPVATTSLITFGSGANASTSTEIIPITGNPNSTRTAVFEGYTLTSPSVYISFESAYAFDECTKPVGKNHTGSIIGFHPDEVSSIHGSLGPQYVTGSSLHFHGSWVPASFNYTNLALTPVPLSVYLDQPSCYDSFCSTIYTDYKPVLSVPQQVLSLDPAWANCDVFWGGVYDPPKALQPTNEAAGPTTPVGYGSTTTTAAPSSTPVSPTVSATALPVTTSAPATSGGDGSQAQPTSTQPAPSPYSSSADDPTQPADPGTTSTSNPGPESTSRTSVDVISTTKATAVSDPEQSASDTDTPDPAGPQPTPSNALEALTQSTHAIASTSAGQIITSGASSDPSVAPTVVLTQSDGQQQTVVQSSGNVVIGGTATIPQGSQSSISGVGVVSVGSTALVVSQEGDASTLQYDAPSDTQSAASAHAVVTAGGQTYTVVSQSGSSAVVVEGPGTTATVPEGSAVTINDQTVSLADGSGVVVGSQIVPISQVTNASPSQEAVVTLQSTTLTILKDPSSSAVVVDGSTLSVGGPAGTVQGQPVSLGTSGVVIVNDESSSTARFNTAASQTTVEVVLTVGSQTVTAYQVAGSSGLVVIDGKTLSAGGSAETASGVLISVASSGVVVDGSTVAFSTATLGPGASDTFTASSQLTEVEAVLTLGTETMTAFQVAGSSGIAEIDGTRLSLGGSVAVVDGHTISVASNGVLQDGTVVSWETTTFAASLSQASNLRTSSLGPWTSNTSSATTENGGASGPGQQSPTTTATSDASCENMSLALGTIVAIGAVWIAAL